MKPEDLKVKPYRKTLRQTAIILNVSVRTVRRYLAAGRIEWSGNQVSVESIIRELKRQPDSDKSDEEIEKAINEVSKSIAHTRRTGSRAH